MSNEFNVNADGAESVEFEIEDESYVVHEPVEFTSDDGDVLQVGYAWPNKAETDDMLAVLHLIDAAGGEGVIVLSRWQVENLYSLVGKVLRGE